MSDTEIDDLLATDLVARLATIDADGYPHVTPIWFLWVDGTMYLTSFAGRPHLERMRANPRVGLVIDVEDAQRGDGQRPNKQIRITGDAVVADDPDGVWTGRIRRKYIDATISPGVADRPLDRPRIVVTIVPSRFYAVASV